MYYTPYIPPSSPFKFYEVMLVQFQKFKTVNQAADEQCGDMG